MSTREYRAAHDYRLLGTATRCFPGTPDPGVHVVAAIHDPAAIIARAVQALDQISVDMKKAIAPMWSGLMDLSSEPDEPPSDEENHVCSFVGAHTIPSRFEKLPTGELLGIHAPGKGGSGNG